MRVIKKILKYLCMIFLCVIMLFALKMTLPVSKDNNNMKKQNNIVYTNKT